MLQLKLPVLAMTHSIMLETVRVPCMVNPVIYKIFIQQNANHCRLITSSEPVSMHSTERQNIKWKLIMKADEIWSICFCSSNNKIKS